MHASPLHARPIAATPRGPHMTATNDAAAPKDPPPLFRPEVAERSPPMRPPTVGSAKPECPPSGCWPLARLVLRYCNAIQWAMGVPV
jgi:hypothetical protein